MTIKDKIKTYINHKGISVNSFEKSIGASNGYIRNTQNVSADVLARMCQVYDDVNTEWLLRDKGEMIVNSQSVGDIKDSTVTGVNISGNGVRINNDRYDDLISIVKSYQRQTEEFQSQISELISIINHGKN